jgi:hypothetical protein
MYLFNFSSKKNFYLGNIYTPLWDGQINLNVQFSKFDDTTNKRIAVTVRKIQFEILKKNN